MTAKTLLSSSFFCETLVDDTACTLYSELFASKLCLRIKMVLFISFVNTAVFHV